MRELRYIKSLAARWFEEGTRISRFNIITAAVLGAPAHFCFYFLFKYYFHLPYESFSLRMIATFFSLSVLAGLWISDRYRDVFKVYWHLVIIFTLPFIFTVNLLKTGFHELWLYWEIFMIFVLISYVPHWFLFLIDLCIGVAGAIVFFLLTSTVTDLTPGFNIPLYSIVVFFTICAGYVFSYSNKKGQIAQERNRALHALAGSIAHEMRNPLGQVQMNLDYIEDSLPGYHPGKASPPLSDRTLESIYRRVAQGKLALNRGMQVITMILDEVKGRPISQDRFICTSAAAVTQKALDEYGFDSDRDRHKVVVDVRQDFMVRIDETKYVFVLFNLLMNALYFLKSRDDARIDIVIEPGNGRNTVRVRDNGPGIPSENLARVFDPYFTSGKNGGTGLGLSYCKRVMEGFGGTISCSSDYGVFTEFVLAFPVVTEAEQGSFREQLVSEYAALFARKRVLVTGEQGDERGTFVHALELLGAEPSVAHDAARALQMLNEASFDLVVMSISMPRMDGYEAVERIRKGDGGEEHLLVPVIVWSGDPLYRLRGKVENAGMQGVISGPWSMENLIKQLGECLQTIRMDKGVSLRGRRVLVTDDSSFNRIVVRSVLERFGIIVDEAADGTAAFEKIGVGRYDLVLMDLMMPGCDGICATRKIRNSTDDEIASLPVIGLSGESDEGIIEEALQAGMNDYLVKPVDTAVLTQKIGQWLKPYQSESRGKELSGTAVVN
ncbi:MAG: response regulator [Prosthecochloris sp.]|nr:response regulator [Prosthecochloris sp.]